MGCTANTLKANKDKKGLVLLLTCILSCLVRSQSGDDIRAVNKIHPGEATNGHLLHKNHSSISAGLVLILKKQF